MKTRSGIDTGYPKTAEIALAIAPIAVGVCLGAIHRLSGSSEQTSAGSEVPPGQFQDLFPAPSRSDAVLSAGHKLLHPQGTPDVDAVGSGDWEVLSQFPFSLRGSLAQHMGAICLLSLQIGTTAPFEALGGRSVCLELGHFPEFVAIGEFPNIDGLLPPGKNAGATSAA